MSFKKILRIRLRIIIFSCSVLQNEEDKRLQEELLQTVDVLKVNKF